jgi:hypothetical protein
VDDGRLAEILVQVNTAWWREVDLGLEEQDWGQARDTIKRKNMILQGKNPEVEEKRKRKMLKMRRSRKVHTAPPVILFCTILLHLHTLFTLRRIAECRAYLPRPWWWMPAAT